MKKDQDLFICGSSISNSKCKWAQETLHRAIMQVSFQHWEKQFNKAGKFLQYLPC